MQDAPPISILSGMEMLDDDFTIVNSEDRIFKTWATVEIRDNQGDIMPIEVFMKSMPTLIKRGAPLHVIHSNIVVGKIINYGFVKEHPKYKKPAMWIEGMIYKDYQSDDEAWNGLVMKRYLGISPAGRIASGPGRVADWFQPWEFSLAPKPANPGATTIVTSIAKDSGYDESSEFDRERAEHPGFTDEQIKQMVSDHKRLIENGNSEPSKNENAPADKEQKLSEIVAKSETIEKPFAGYKDFDDCVAKNPEKENPQAYCATIMRSVEKTGTLKKDSEGLRVGEQVADEKPPEQKKEEIVKKEPTPPVEEKKPDEKKPDEAQKQETPAGGDGSKEMLTQIVAQNEKIIQLLSAMASPATSAAGVEKCGKEIAKGAGAEVRDIHKSAEDTATQVPRPEGQMPYDLPGQKIKPEDKDNPNEAVKIAKGEKKADTLEIVKKGLGKQN
ncbi:MAG: hypothetical protein WC350_05570 [Candidatus Micrarchaeia archaeon]|jgi:hypothetical protein